MDSMASGGMGVVSWMGYGGLWLSLLLVVAVVGLVAWAAKQKAR